MSCSRCGGKLLGDGEDYFCLQCGWRKDSKILHQIERRPNSARIASVLPLTSLVEEYLKETNDDAQKAKQLLSEKKELVRMLRLFWRQRNLAQWLTLENLILMECWSVFDEEIDNKIENLGSIKLLRNFRLDDILRETRKQLGGRPTSAKVIDLALKMVLCASYQWLRAKEVELEVAKSRSSERKKARAAAYMSLKNAHRLSRRVLFKLGPDIDHLHAILTRALWEDKYQPVVITVNGTISDVTY